MKFQIKKYLIEEGITDFVKNNWGKGLVAASGIIMANAGVFGDQAQKAVSMGGDKLNNFVKDAGDWSKKSFDKLEQKYGDTGNTNPSAPQNNPNSSNPNTQNTNQNSSSPNSLVQSNLDNNHHA